MSLTTMIMWLFLSLFKLYDRPIYNGLFVIANSSGVQTVQTFGTDELTKWVRGKDFQNVMVVEFIFNFHISFYPMYIMMSRYY